MLIHQQVSRKQSLAVTWLWDWRPSIDTLEDDSEAIFSESERVIDSRLTWTAGFCNDHFIWDGQIVVGWTGRVRRWSALNQGTHIETCEGSIAVAFNDRKIRLNGRICLCGLNIGAAGARCGRS